MGNVSRDTPRRTDDFRPYGEAYDPCLDSYDEAIPSGARSIVGCNQPMTRKYYPAFI